MIKAECLIFLTMLAGGVVAGAVAMLFLALGTASKVSRCIFDFLTPLAVSGVYLITGYLASGGVFRLYALLAFLLGGWIFRLLYRRSRPYLKKLIFLLIVPIKSLEDAMAKQLEPIRERARRRRAIRAERREKRRMLLEEKRRKAREERDARNAVRGEKRAARRRLSEAKKAKGREKKRRERSALTHPSTSQSH